MALATYIGFAATNAKMQKNRIITSCHYAIKRNLFALHF
jgi:hypothetical protein